MSELSPAVVDFHKALSNQDSISMASSVPNEDEVVNSEFQPDSSTPRLNSIKKVFSSKVDFIKPSFQPVNKTHHEALVPSLNGNNLMFNRDCTAPLGKNINNSQ